MYSGPKYALRFEIKAYIKGCTNLVKGAQIW